MTLKGLIACEESQVVCKAFREQGIETWSCDILPESGGHPEWHIQRDIIDFIEDIEERIDFVIAFPPCTHLTVRAQYWNKIKNKHEEKYDAINFFMLFAELDVKYKAIENPIGIMSTVYRKPDQIIHPYWFGDPEQKKTCLWLYNLPPLVPTNMVEPIFKYYATGYKVSFCDKFSPSEDRQRLRSKTFPGIGNAMATQWSKHMFKMEGII